MRVVVVVTRGWFCGWGVGRMVDCKREDREVLEVRSSTDYSRLHPLPFTICGPRIAPNDAQSRDSNLQSQLGSCHLQSPASVLMLRM